MPAPINPIDAEKQGGYLVVKLFQMGNIFSTSDETLEHDTYSKKDVMLYMCALEENGVPLHHHITNMIETYKSLAKDDTTDGKALMQLYARMYRSCRGMLDRLPEFTDKKLIVPKVVGYITYKYFKNCRVRKNFEALKTFTDLALFHNPKGRQFYMKVADGTIENIEFEITFYKPEIEKEESDETIF